MPSPPDLAGTLPDPIGSLWVIPNPLAPRLAGPFHPSLDALRDTARNTPS